MIDKELLKIRSRKYYLKHRERLALRAKERAIANPEQYSIRSANRRINQRVAYLYTLAKHRANKKNIEFTISVEDIGEIPEYCPLLNIRINNRVRDLSASLDRIDNTRGYIRGNVLIISWRANRLKNDSCAKELMLLTKSLATYEEDL